MWEGGVWEGCWLGLLEIGVGGAEGPGSMGAFPGACSTLMLVLLNIIVSSLSKRLLMESWLALTSAASKS